MNSKRTSMFSKRILTHVIFSGLLEFGPVLIFLLSFDYLSIYESTVLLMLATIISTLVTYQLQKRIPYLALYVAMITTLFGYLTLHFQEVKFIQMRDTLYDLTCASVLSLGIVINIPFLKMAFGEVIPMTSQAWHKLTTLWIVYFCCIALSNEIVRRFFSLEDWFTFKTCMVFVTSFFGLTALYYSFEPEDKKDDN